MKNILLITIILSFVFVGIAEAASKKPEVLGDEDIVMSGTTVYTLTRTSGAVKALVGVQGDTVRWKGHDTNPTADNGNLLYVGDYLLLESSDEIDNFKVILDDATSGATTYIIYYGPEDKR